MVRISAVFIAVCMVLIAGSLGAVLFLAFQISAAMSSIVALAALTAMALYSTISNRLRDRRDIGDQIADLSRGTADLARQVAEINRRMAAVENVSRRSATDPLAAEISELGGLVKQLAETVAAHETELYRRIAADGVAPQIVAAPPPLDLPETAVVTPEQGAPAQADRPEAPAAATPPPAGETVSGARRFLGMSREAIAQLVAGAVDANRIDLYLQPIVTLPQRKVRFYEAMSRLRSEDGDVIPAADFLEYAEAAGLMPKIDNLLLFRCVQVMRRLQLKNREIGVFCNVSASTLADAAFFQQFLDFMEANRVLAPALVFEFSHAAYRGFGPIENEALSALAERGYRFSLDHVADLRLEPKELSERSFRFLKVPARLLLDRSGAPQGADIHPADLADLLARSGIDLIAERIESENMVVDLLDYDVRFGQGFLFSPPRPVRAEALQSAAETAAMPDEGMASAAVDKPSELLSAVAGRR